MERKNRGMTEEEIEQRKKKEFTMLMKQFMREAEWLYNELIKRKRKSDGEKKD